MNSDVSEIEFDFLEFLELAKLFLISERDSYYGYFLMNMQFLQQNGYADLYQLFSLYSPQMFVFLKI